MLLTISIQANLEPGMIQLLELGHQACGQLVTVGGEAPVTRHSMFLAETEGVLCNVLADVDRQQRLAAKP